MLETMVVNNKKVNPGYGFGKAHGGKKCKEVYWGKKGMSKKLTVALFVLAIGWFAVTANASPVGTVDIAYSGLNAVDTMTVWGGGHDGENIYAGEYTVNKTGGTGQGNLWANGNIGIFCIDLPEWASSNTLSYDVVKLDEGPVTNPLFGGPMGEQKADFLSELWGRFYNSSWGDGSYTAQDKNDAEAFAADVWEIVFEDLPSVSGNAWDVTKDGTAGNLGFRAENLDWSKANSWLSQLDGTGPKADLRAFTNAGAQDYLVQVPEPATLVLFGLGSLLFVRKNRKAAV